MQKQETRKSSARARRKPSTGKVRPTRPSQGPAVFSLGTGRLDWSPRERRSDRYGSVTLDPPVTAAALVPVAGRRGRLVALVRETRQSGHIGDIFRGISPSTPAVGDRIVLGSGMIRGGFDNGPEYTHEAVVVEPDDGRETDWLDPRALYRAHSQTVELLFEVGGAP